MPFRLRLTLQKTPYRRPLVFVATTHFRGSHILKNMGHHMVLRALSLQDCHGDHNPSSHQIRQSPWTLATQLETHRCYQGSNGHVPDMWATPAAIGPLVHGSTGAAAKKRGDFTGKSQAKCRLVRPSNTTHDKTFHKTEALLTILSRSDRGYTTITHLYISIHG